MEVSCCLTVSLCKRKHLLMYGKSANQVSLCSCQVKSRHYIEQNKNIFTNDRHKINTKANASWSIAAEARGTMCFADIRLSCPFNWVNPGRGCGVDDKRVYFLSFDAQPLICVDHTDVVRPAGEKMSTKRKAESHSRPANRPRIMKSGGSQADSERDSGFSGFNITLISVFFTCLSRKKALVLTFYPSAYRCKLRAYEHDGHHRLWGFTPPSCKTGSADFWF